MIHNTIISVVIFMLFSCSAQTTEKNTKSTEVKEQPTQKFRKELKVGAEKISKLVTFLNHKSFGIVGNQSSEINGTHLVDTLISLGEKPNVVFAPEHGFRGKKDAGEKIKDGRDPKTGIPIISLYGSHKKPTQEDLKGLDFIIFDIQDVGARFYTYISTLHYVMEACAENNIKIIVLDRPNPNGHYVDGPILEKEHKSFVGMHPIPVVHGMTIGEYAKMINGEKWLNGGVICDLEIFTCENYSHSTPYNLPIKPSPNLPNSKSINLYPSLCFFEGTTVSVGRGTKSPFQLFGSPELKGSFEFTPKSGPGSKYPKHENKICFGENLKDYRNLNQLHLDWLIESYKSSKKPFFKPFFTKLAGTKKLQSQIESGLTAKEIRESWKIGLENFKQIRAKYLLYSDD